VTKTHGQLAVLGGLLAVMGGVVVWQGDGGGSAAAPASQAAPASGGAAGASPVTGLRLDRLTAESTELADAARNPFRFRPRPEPVRVVAPVARPEPVVPAGPVGPPPPPPIPLKFIGVLDAPGRVGRLAILSDSRGGVFYGKEGDAIEGRYRVLRVSTESADLAYMDGRGRQTIRLSGQ